MLQPISLSIRRSVGPIFTASCVALGVLLLTAGTASADLIGYYNFDGSTSDSSGHNNNPLAGSVSGYVTGYQGQAGSFNGSSSHLELGINISPSLMPNLTMGAWVSASVATGKSGILSADDSSPGDFDRTIAIDDRNLSGNSTGSYSYAAFVGGSANLNVLTSGQAPTSAFTFVAVRYTGTGVTLFVGNQTYNVTASPTDLNQNPRLWIGKNPSYDNYFTGAIDNVFIFDQALTDAQVNSIRLNGVASVVPEPGTLAACGTILAVFGLARLRVRRAKGAVK